MTHDVKRTPAEVLRAARRRDSDRKRDQVFRTVEMMKREGTPITFASVARSARVSQWLVYAEGVREYILSARNDQAAEPQEARRTGQATSGASLRTDLELARQDNRGLRSEVDRLRKAMREHLGAQLELASTRSLQERIDELTEANQRYRSEISGLTTALEELRLKLAAAEDDLAAARTSVRRMMRSQDPLHE